MESFDKMTDEMKEEQRAYVSLTNFVSSYPALPFGNFANCEHYQQLSVEESLRCRQYIATGVRGDLDDHVAGVALELMICHPEEYSGFKRKCATIERESKRFKLAQAQMNYSVPAETERNTRVTVPNDKLDNNFASHKVTYLKEYVATIPQVERCKKLFHRLINEDEFSMESLRRGFKFLNDTLYKLGWFSIGFDRNHYLFLHDLFYEGKRLQHFKAESRTKIDRQDDALCLWLKDYTLFLRIFSGIKQNQVTIKLDLFNKHRRFCARQTIMMKKTKKSQLVGLETKIAVHQLAIQHDQPKSSSRQGRRKFRVDQNLLRADAQMMGPSAMASWFSKKAVGYAASQAKDAVYTAMSEFVTSLPEKIVEVFKSAASGAFNILCLIKDFVVSTVTFLKDKLHSLISEAMPLVASISSYLFALGFSLFLLISSCFSHLMGSARDFILLGITAGAEAFGYVINFDTSKYFSILYPRGAQAEAISDFLPAVGAAVSIALGCIDYKWLSLGNGVVNFTSRFSQTGMSIVDGITSILDDIYFYFTQEHFVKDRKCIQMLLDWMNKATELFSRKNFDERVYVDLDLCAEFERLYKEGRTIKSILYDMKLAASISTQFTKLFADVDTLQNDLIKRGDYYKTRIETPLLWLYGEPGHGKTNSYEFIAAAVYDRLRKAHPEIYNSKFHKGLLYNRNPIDMYWEGLPDNCLAVIWDDALAMEDAKTRALTCGELIAACQDGTYNLNMAFEDKGKKLFAAPLGIVTSNIGDEAIKYDCGLTDPCALVRRMTIKAEVVRVADFDPARHNFDEAWQYIVHRPDNSPEFFDAHKKGFPSKLYERMMEEGKVPLTFSEVVNILFDEIERRTKKRTDKSEMLREFDFASYVTGSTHKHATAFPVATEIVRTVPGKDNEVIPRRKKQAGKRQQPPPPKKLPMSRCVACDAEWLQSAIHISGVCPPCYKSFKAYDIKESPNTTVKVANAEMFQSYPRQGTGVRRSLLGGESVATSISNSAFEAIRSVRMIASEAYHPLLDVAPPGTTYLYDSVWLHPSSTVTRTLHGTDPLELKYAYSHVNSPWTSFWSQLWKYSVSFDPSQRRKIMKIAKFYVLGRDNSWLRPPIIRTLKGYFGDEIGRKFEYLWPHAANPYPLENMLAGIPDNQPLAGPVGHFIYALQHASTCQKHGETDTYIPLKGASVKDVFGCFSIMRMGLTCPKDRDLTLLEQWKNIKKSEKLSLKDQPVSTSMYEKILITKCKFYHWYNTSPLAQYVAKGLLVCACISGVVVAGLKIAESMRPKPEVQSLPPRPLALFAWANPVIPCWTDRHGRIYYANLELGDDEKAWFYIHRGERRWVNSNAQYWNSPSSDLEDLRDIENFSEVYLRESLFFEGKQVLLDYLGFSYISNASLYVLSGNEVVELQVSDSDRQRLKLSYVSTGPEMWSGDVCSPSAVGYRNWTPAGHWKESVKMDSEKPVRVVTESLTRDTLPNMNPQKPIQIGSQSLHRDVTPNMNPHKPVKVGTQSNSRSVLPNMDPQRPIKIVPAQSGNFDQYYNIADQMRLLEFDYVVGDKTVVFEHWALFSGYRALLTSHFFQSLGMNFENVSVINGTTVVGIYSRSMCKFGKLDDKRDLFYIDFPQRAMNPMKNIRSKLFASKEELNKSINVSTTYTRLHKFSKDGQYSLNLVQGSNIKEGQDALLAETSPGEGVVSVDYYGLVGSVSEKGDCGLPYTHKNENGVVMIDGLHFAGAGIYSYFCPIYKSDFDNSGAYVPSYVEIADAQCIPRFDGKICFMGRTPHPKIIPSETNIKPSVFQGDGIDPPLYPVTQRPAFLKPTLLYQAGEEAKEAVESMIPVSIQPLKYAMNKLQATPCRKLRRWMAQFVDRYPDRAFEGFLPLSVRSASMKRWTIEQVLFGIPGVWAGLARDTAIGYDMERMGFKSRKEIWDPETRFIAPELRRLVLELDKAVADGLEPKNVVAGCLKDETRANETVEVGNTRLFCVGALSHLVWTIMNLGAAVTHCKQARGTHGVAIGINPHGVEWKLIFHELTKFGLETIIAGDYKGYDTSIQSFFGTLLAKAFNRMYQYDESSLNYRILLAVCKSTIAPILIIGNEVYWMDYFNSSGGWCTGVLNSFVNIMIFNFIWFYLQSTIDDEEFKKTRISKAMTRKVYGDDNVANIHPRWAKYFNMHVLEELVFEFFGMRYTTPSKGVIDKPFLDITELEFLKRKFRVENGNVHCPLDKESIYNMLLWIKTPKLIDGERASLAEQLAINVEVAAREFYHYGREDFEQETSKLRAACKKYNVMYTGHSYDYYEERWLEGLHASAACA